MSSSPSIPCVEVVVRADGRLNATDLGEHLSRAPSGSVRLDLSRLTFIEPAGLVSLAVIAEIATSMGRIIEFTEPMRADVATYLSRMRLGEQLDRLGVAHRLPTVQEQVLGSRLVELHRFDGQEGLERVIEALIKTFIEERPTSVQPLYTALHEIASNVVQHSGCGYGYAALQRFVGRGDVAFAVGDPGLGLRGRLSEHYAIPDDRFAIARAAQTHVSTMDSPGRGRGIARVIAVTGTHRGEVRLLSGRAAGAFRNGNPNAEFTDLSSPHPGTLAVVRLNL